MSSKNKLSNANKVPEIAETLQPMTELYLREFFKNHALAINQKEKQTMFNNSIEVLNFLIEEYQEKFEIQRPHQDENQAFEDGVEFEGFYNRLRNIFQSIYFKFQSFQTQLGELMSGKGKMKQNYNECLFPQNQILQKRFKQPLKLDAETDEQLYQLVIELKKQTQKDSQKIKSLEKEMKEKVKENKNLEQKLNASLEEIKKQKKQNMNLMQSLGKTVEEKTQFLQKLKKTEEKWKQLKHESQKTEVLLLLKDQQIRRLQITEKSYLENLNQKAQIKEKLSDLTKNLNVLTSEKSVLQQRLNECDAEKEKFRLENVKLKNIILKKLSLIESNETQNKQNMNQNIKLSESTINYMNEITFKIFKDEKLISKTIEKEIRAFVHNQMMKNSILIKNRTTNQLKETEKC